MPTLDDIILRYNTFITPTQEEVDEVAKYIPREFIVLPVTANAWFQMLAWANKERRERISAVAERVMGHSPGLDEPDLDPMLRWMADKQKAAQAQAFKNKAIVGSGFQESDLRRAVIGDSFLGGNLHGAIKKVSKF